MVSVCDTDMKTSVAEHRSRRNVFRVGSEYDVEISANLLVGIRVIGATALSNVLSISVSKSFNI
jgi:hypothetical protein